MCVSLSVCVYSLCECVCVRAHVPVHTPVLTVLFLCLSRDMVKKVSQVTLPELTEVGKKYLAPLFDPSLTRCVACVHPSKVEEVTADFKK